MRGKSSMGHAEFKLTYFSRLDAGTFGTMGVGLGFAIAAAILIKNQDKMLDPPASRVVCIQGDSAFGFSGMELETVFRLVYWESGAHIFCRGQLQLQCTPINYIREV